MIYRNDNIKINDDSVTGTLKDLKEFFRYEIAHQCMGHNISDEEFIYNTKELLIVIENLEEDLENDLYKEYDILTIKQHPMGGFYIEGDE